MTDYCTLSVAADKARKVARDRRKQATADDCVQWLLLSREFDPEARQWPSRYQ